MEQFYFDQRDTIKRVLVDKKLIFIGNFNARIGSYTEKWKGAPGCNEVGKCNSNEQLLLASVRRMALWLQIPSLRTRILRILRRTQSRNIDT